MFVWDYISACAACDVSSDLRYQAQAGSRVCIHGCAGTQCGTVLSLYLGYRIDEDFSSRHVDPEQLKCWRL